MDYTSYKDAYFTKPPPKQLYQFRGSFGTTLYYEDYIQAVAYYEKVLGPPGYVEGIGTRGWQIGDGWLTLLKGTQGNPKNVEITFEMATVEQAEKLQQSFIDAGGKGSPPSNQLMYTPVRFCPVIDPFGVDLLVISQLDDDTE